MRQSRSRDEPSFKAAIQESINKIDNNGSKEHIVENLEMGTYNTAGSLRATSETSMADGVIEERLAVVRQCD